MKKQCLVAAALAGALGVTNAAAQSSSQPGDWRFSLTPYLWFPTVKSTAQFSLPSGVGGGTATVEKDADDYLSKLDMAAMLTFEARKGAWAIFTDFIYLDFSKDSASVKTLSGPGGLVQVPVNTGTQVGLEGGVWQLAASYNFSQGKASSPFEVLGGFRYLKMEPTVDWQLTGPVGAFPQVGSFSQTAELWDVIVGVRGRVKLGEGSWFLPYYADLGTGSSALTAQALLGVGYAFKWGEMIATYRYIYYDLNGDGLLQDVRFAGPAVGATFRF